MEWYFFQSRKITNHSHEKPLLSSYTVRFTNGQEALARFGQIFGNWTVTPKPCLHYEPRPSFGLDFCSVNALRPGRPSPRSGNLGHQNRCSTFPNLGQAQSAFTLQKSSPKLGLGQA
jgi:hypothetical protein